MPRLFPTRSASDTPANWADDPKYQAALDRLAAVKEELTERRNRLTGAHAAAIRGLQAELDRAEMEVLAGKGSEATLAAVQAKHTAARVARAKDALAVEDLEAEQRTLETETAPSARRAAKEATIKAIRKVYRTYLEKIQAGLAQAVEYDAKLNALMTDADRQFPPYDGNAFSDVDPDGFPKGAALWAVSRTIYSIATGGPVGRRAVEGNTAAFLDLIDKALDALDADEKATAAAGTARKQDAEGTVKQPPNANKGLA